MGSPDPLLTFRRVPERAGFQREELEAFAEKLRTELTGGREFHCRITGDAEMRRLNRDYRGKDYATDVLSFPADSEFSGDIAISRQRASAQAQQFGQSLTEELQVLLLHGVLHLMGMDHERDRGEMARKERQWQVRLGLPTGVIRRSRTQEVA